MLTAGFSTYTNIKFTGAQIGMLVGEEWKMVVRQKIL
jgi:hypothetical protein